LRSNNITGEVNLFTDNTGTINLGSNSSSWLNINRNMYFNNNRTISSAGYDSLGSGSTMNLGEASRTANINMGSGLTSGNINIGNSAAAGTGTINLYQNVVAAKGITASSSKSVTSAPVGGLRVQGTNQWIIGENSGGQLCFYQGNSSTTPLACITTAGNLVAGTG